MTFRHGPPSCLKERQLVRTRGDYLKRPPMQWVQDSGTKTPCEHRKGQQKTELFLEHKTTQQREAPRTSWGNQAHRRAWLGEVFCVNRRHSAGDETESGRSMWPLNASLGAQGEPRIRCWTSQLSHSAAKIHPLKCTRHENQLKQLQSKALREADFSASKSWLMRSKRTHGVSPSK